MLVRIVYVAVVEVPRTSQENNKKSECRREREEQPIKGKMKSLVSCDMQYDEDSILLKNNI